MKKLEAGSSVLLDGKHNVFVVIDDGTGNVKIKDSQGALQRVRRGRLSVKRRQSDTIRQLDYVSPPKVDSDLENIRAELARRVKSKTGVPWAEARDREVKRIFREVVEEGDMPDWKGLWRRFEEYMRVYRRWWYAVGKKYLTYGT